MSKSRKVKELKSRNTKCGELVCVGSTPEEIQEALVRGMRDLLAGRITVKEANRIAHAANMQLHRLRVMDWLERMAKQKRSEVKESNGRKREGSFAPLRMTRGSGWVN